LLEKSNEINFKQKNSTVGYNEMMPIKKKSSSRRLAS